jgi:hypothetical protein
MLRTFTTSLALCVIYLGLYASASKVSIWLPTPEDDKIMTLTVLQHDWTLPHTNAKDHRDDKGEYVVEERVKVEFSEAGSLLFDDVSPIPVRFWVREGDTDSPTRGMSSVSHFAACTPYMNADSSLQCTATFDSTTKLDAGSELKLFLAPKGGTSLWDGQDVKDLKWLICGATDLFEVPVAGTLEDGA